MKLLFVFGARPEAIKLAPVVRGLAARPGFQGKICATGQHRDILEPFLEMFDLPWDWNLGVMRPEDLTYLTGAVLSGVGGVLDAWVWLLKNCHFVVTDSGGIQEEAPSFGKPVLVTRETTERPEAMELGLAKLVGTDEHRLFQAMAALLDDPQAYQSMNRVANPYGDGKASARIADRLTSVRTSIPSLD